MRPSLTITDRIRGGSWKFPEEAYDLVVHLEDELTEEISDIKLIFNSDSESAMLLTWWKVQSGEEDSFDLSHSFTISFPNTLTKEVVREVLKSERELIAGLSDASPLMLKRIAARLHIYLEETTNA